MDRDGVESLAVEPRRKAGRTDLRPREDEDLPKILLADQVGEKLLFSVPIDRIHELPDRLDGRISRRDLDLGRVVEDRPRQAPDLVGEGRREHQVLALRREQRRDPLDVGQEAHVEHPIGLVEDEDLDLAEVGDSLADEIEEPPWCGDEDLDTLAERPDLGLHRHSTVDDRRPKRNGPAVGPNALVDLHRELARRDEDQRPYRVASR